MTAIDYAVFLALLADDAPVTVAPDSPEATAALDAFTADHGVDAVDRDGRTLLMNAASRGRHALMSGLLARGADVGARDRDGFRALHFAALEDDADAAVLLLDAGADVDARDGWGNSALWRAAMTHDADALVTRVLLDRGANPGLANDHGVTPNDLLG